VALTYFDVYADAYRRKVMTEGQLVTAVRLARVTLPQAREIVATSGQCGALWVPPAPADPDPTPAAPESSTAPAEQESEPATAGG